MLLATNTWHGAPVVYVWKSFPTKDNQQPDYIIENSDFGTPRGIVIDGKTYLIVGDHNPSIEGESIHGGAFVWHSFPESGKEPYDAFIEGLTWNIAIIGDDLFGITITGIPVLIKNFRSLKGIIKLEGVERPDFKLPDNVIVFRNVILGGGDGSKTIYIGNLTYISLYNENRIVGYFGKPEDRKPDFEIGTEHPIYFVDNPIPISDGETLVILGSFSQRLVVYKRLPDESGAIPDIIYELPFEPISGEFWNGKFYLIGRRGFMVWNVSALKNGEEHEISLKERDKLGGVSIEEGRDIAFDERYAYIVSNWSLYVYKQPFSVDSKPLKEIKLEGCNEVKRVHSNGEKLAITCVGRDYHGVYLLNIDTVLSETPKYIRLEKIFGHDVFITKDKLFVSNTGYNWVVIFNEIPEKTDALPDVIIGKEEFEPNLLPEESIPEYTRSGFFWPEGIWYDGHFLWVGELKFSGRVLRYSPR